MRISGRLFGILLAGCALVAADLGEIKAQGRLRHLGIPYANFVSGAGDGMDVELVQRFARSIGVTYEYVATDWGTVIQDLVGRKVSTAGGKVQLGEAAPVKGDLIANGFTVLPWRQEVVSFSEPTFPSQIWLVARAESPVRPIKPTGDLDKDIAATRALLKGHTLLTLEKTCLDPSLFRFEDTDVMVKAFQGRLNEIAPALLRGDAELTILDVPDALVAMEKWRGRFKILGPISHKQLMGAGFPKDAPELRAAYDAFLRRCKKDGTYLALVRKYYPTAHLFFPEFFKGMK